MVGYSCDSATTIAQVGTSSPASQYSNMWGLLLGKVTEQLFFPGSLPSTFGTMKIAIRREFPGQFLLDLSMCCNQPLLCLEQ